MRRKKNQHYVENKYHVRAAWQLQYQNNVKSLNNLKH